MITASVVLFNTPAEYVKTVAASFSPSENRVLFLVDNSPEESGEYSFLDGMEGVRYIFNGKNLGYGKANNIAIRMAFEMNSDYHLVLNPDVSFSPGLIDELASYADCHPDVVYLMPKIVDENGELQHLCKLLPKPSDLILRRFAPKTKRVTANDERYTLAASGYDKIINPPCLSGCFMFMRTSALKENSLLFDERFFMYCEDFDLMRRLHRVGKTVYYPFARAVHKNSAASYSNPVMLLHHIASACRYFNKYGWISDAERDTVNRETLEELGL